MRKILVSILILVSVVGSMFAKTENSKNAVKPDKKWWKEAIIYHMLVNSNH
jgi:uncharacterized membrane protein